MTRSSGSGVKIVRRVLADGSVREYRYERRAARLHEAPRAPTLSDLFRLFRDSVEWRGLRPGTRALYERAMREIEASAGAHAIDAFRRRHVLRIRDRLADRPGVCNGVLTVLGRCFSWAMDREMLEVNPAARIARLPTTPHRRWTWAQIGIAARELPEPLVRAMSLALYTGQRLGDVAAMRWNDIDGQGVRVVQQKTGAKLWVPLHPDLQAMAATWPRDAVTILTSSIRRPWKAISLSSRFSHEIAAVPELRGLTFHGLRITAASVLAELGCTTHEIASITGHRTLAMVEHYTHEADQRRLALSAMKKWENARLSR